MRSRRNNTTLTRKIDKWNTHKVWLIKRYADGHYAINQEVGGRVFYSSYIYQKIPRTGYICPHCESRLRAGETLPNIQASQKARPQRTKGATP